MPFISTEFLVFICIAAPLFFVVPQRFRVTYLLIASLIFYGYGHPASVLLLAGGIGIDYAIARAIGNRDSQAARRRLLALSLIINVGTLLAFKYAGFFSETAARLFNASLPSIALVVPLGISFYTFTKIAYVVDVYRGVTAPEKNPVTFGAFVSFFPNLISGPIERAGHLIPQLTAKGSFEERRVVEGLRLILWGAFKKVVIADHLAIYVNPVYDQPHNYQGLTLIAATLFLAFQIYADFSGYTDMARGIARIFGIDLFENFRQPYLAKSILEFWRRWHISLTTWIREYLFLPLSRTLLRRTHRRHAREIEVGVYLLVMGLVGLWHGASWTFVAWGLLHGLYMGTESLVNARKIRVLPRTGWAEMAKTAGVFLLVAFSWIFFRAHSLSDVGYVIAHLFDFGGDFLASFSVYSAGSPAAQPAICVGMIGLLLAADWVDARRGLLATFGERRAVVRWAAYYALAALILMALISAGTVQEFVYFKF
jgi:D-alanyl-lipoteichoic acid acyltransferase DltB (MBOAT superfamily)